MVVDWTSARPTPGALVVAMLLPDSLPYRGLADSSGHFSLGPLPAGEYIVSGVLDENRNHLADPREAFDSVRAARRRTAPSSSGPSSTTRARPASATVSQQDSVSATRGVHPAARPEAASPADRGAGVAACPTPPRCGSLRILPEPLDDSLHGRSRAADTDTADGADTTAVRDTTLPPPRRAAHSARRLAAGRRLS